MRRRRLSRRRGWEITFENWTTRRQRETGWGREKEYYPYTAKAWEVRTEVNWFNKHYLRRMLHIQMKAQHVDTS
jgi:hypothetical protein